MCWTLERIEGVLWTREVLVLRNTDTPEQVDILRRRLQRATRVALDCTGPGVGLGDYLKREFGEWLPAQHSYGRIELCTFSVAFNREIFPLLRRQFTAPRLSGARVPVSRAVREDLHAMQQVVTNGEYNLTLGAACPKKATATAAPHWPWPCGPRAAPPRRVPSSPRKPRR